MYRVSIPSVAVLVLGVALLVPRAAASQTADPSFVSVLDEQVPAWLADLTTPGAVVALIEDGQVVFARGYGRRDEQGDRVTPDTGFNVGSISKTVTAWGVMRLVERGLVDLDAPVARYLTRWSLPPSEFDPDGVTVRRLLSHTAGLSLHGYPGFGPDDPLPSLEESLSGATNGSGDVRIVYEPGTEWRYSGGGYTVLQLLIEEVSGRSFTDYMRDEVLHPLGMTRSDFATTDTIAAGASTAYDEFGDPIASPRFTALAAAGLMTTVEDLARFAAAVVPGPNGEPAGRGVLAPETVALMIRPAAASEGTYGLGYGVEQLSGDRVMVVHNGANRGWHAAFAIAPDNGNGFVVLTNGSNGWPVHRLVRAAWIEQETGERPSYRIPVNTALVREIRQHGVEAAIERYRTLKRDEPTLYEFTEWQLNGLGYALLSRGRVEDAIAIFELNVAEYPDAANPYDSLAEAYMVAGDEARAIANYRRSLELNPENVNAARKLEELGAD